MVIVSISSHCCLNCLKECLYSFTCISLYHEINHPCRDRMRVLSLNLAFRAKAFCREEPSFEASNFVFISFEVVKEPILAI